MIEQIKKIFGYFVAVLEFIKTYFKSLLFLLIIFLIFGVSKNETLNKKANLAEIRLYGAIIDANELLEKIEKMKKNPEIKGVLFEVNSPGGAVAPSVEISQAIKRLKKNKTGGGLCFWSYGKRRILCRNLGK